MKKIAVYCGSSEGNNKIFIDESYRLGKVLAEKGIGVVYGGAKVGLMGAVANGSLENGGKVYGVITEQLQDVELEHKGLTELKIVNTMQERKDMMYELGEGTITLPGGFGTMDELFEVITYTQLGINKTPVGLLNLDGYYDHLVKFMDNIVNEGLLAQNIRNTVLVDSTIEGLLEKMESYVPPTSGKWN